MKSLENLYIEGDVTKEAFSVDPDVEVEYCRLKTQCFLTSQIPVGFSIALLNIRSLSKHIVDIATDPLIQTSNIILLTETQLLYNQERNMQNRFENHQLVTVDRFKTLAFLKENNISRSLLPCNGTLFAEFILPFKAFEKLSVLLTYRSKDIEVQDFVGQITYLITLHNLDLVLGDFNINTLKDLPLLDTKGQRGTSLFVIFRI